MLIASAAYAVVFASAAYAVLIASAAEAVLIASAAYAVLIALAAYAVLIASAAYAVLIASAAYAVLITACRASRLIRTVLIITPCCLSQNGMGSAYVGRCFSDKVTGSWIGGGGLFALGHGPVLPNKAGTCQTPGIPAPAEGCKYWPVYPCHESDKSQALQSCIQFYSNDPITVDQQDPTHTKGHGLYSGPSQCTAPW